MTRTNLKKWFGSFLPAKTLAKSTRKAPRKRGGQWKVEGLEDRTLLSYTPVGYSPSQIEHAYGIDLAKYGSIVGDGAGQTIAIIDAYDDPALVDSTNPNFATSDLAQFDAQFGIPNPPSFKKIAQDGSNNYPPQDLGWDAEISIDVEWSHAIAPMANIILVEANNQDSDSTGTLYNLDAAMNYAKNIPGVSVISMSYGPDGFNGTAAQNNYYQTPAGHTGVSFLYASGDDGVPGSPFYPNCLLVGGTTLNLNTDNTIATETGWGDGNDDDGASGGGYSQDYTQYGFGPGSGYSNVFARPSYQNGYNTQPTRGIPDVALDADPNTGYAVYDSNNNTTDGGWNDYPDGGTSVACPIWAGIIAIADQFRVDSGKGTLDGGTELLPAIYGQSSTANGIFGCSQYDFHDITSGNNTNPSSYPGYPAVPGYSATVGWDPVTGNGTPYANLLINDLAGVDGYLQYEAPDVSNNDISVSLNGNYIQISDNGTVVETKAIATTTEVIIDGADGVSNTVTSDVDFNAINTPLVFNGGTGGTNTLDVEGTTNSDAIEVQGSTVLVNGKPISFTGIQSVVINGNGGTDAFNVTPPTGTTTITINGGSPQGSLDYHGNGTVTPAGGGSGTITQSGYDTVNYTGISSVTTDLNLVYFASDTSANDFTVQTSGTLIQIDDNGVLVDSATIATTPEVIIYGGPNVANSVIVQASYNSSSVPFEFVGGTGNQNTMQIDGNTTSETYGITPAEVSLEGNPLLYSNVQTLTVDGVGSDTFFVIPSTTTAITVNDVSGGSLIFAGSATITPSSSTSGTITSAGFLPLDYTGIQSITTNALGYFAPHTGANVLVLQVVGANIQITDNGSVVASTAIATTTKVLIYGGTGVTNSLYVNANYNPLGIAVLFTGGSGGTNTLQIEGSAAVDSFTANSTGVLLDNTSYTYANTQFLILDGNGGGDTFNVTPSSSTNIAVNAGSPGGSLTYVGAGILNLTTGAVGSGTIDSSGVSPVTYTGVTQTLDFTGGYQLVIQAPTTFGNDVFDVARNGTGIATSINGINPLAGANVLGALTGVLLDASNDNTTLIVDNSAGVVNVSISFTGGSGSNTIQVIGSSSQTLKRQTLSLTTLDDGELILDPDNSGGPGETHALDTAAGTVNFTNASTVTDTSAATEFDFLGGTGGNKYTIQDGGVVSGSQTMQILDTESAGTETLNVANAGIVTVSGYGGADTFNLNGHTHPTGVNTLDIYGNELTGGTLNSVDAATETFSVGSTAAGMTTVVTAGGGTANFTIAGSGLQGNNTFLGNNATNNFTLNTGTAITATSVDISGVALASHDTLNVNGLLLGGSTTVRLGTGAFGQKLLGLGTTVGFDTIGTVDVNGVAGINNLTVVDATPTLYGGVGPTSLNLAAGILYRPMSATSGDFRFNVDYTGKPITPAAAPTIGFSDINGSLTLNGNGLGTGPKDTLTVLGLSALGGSSALYDEATSSNPADKVTITATEIDIVNASLGAMRSIDITPNTLQNLVYRAGNKSAPYGDTINVTPSSAVNIFIDGMSGKTADALNVVGTGSKTDTRITTPSLGGPQIRVTLPSGASFGYTNLQTITGATYVAVGSDAGSVPLVRVFTPGNLSQPKWILQPYSSNYKGGVRVAVGDVNGDGIPDIVCVNGTGADTDVVVYDGVTGQQIENFIAFVNYAGGASVAVADVNGDGYDDIIVGTSEGSSHVKVFSGKNGSLLDSFLAFAPGYTGGINVAAGDVQGPGQADIVVGTASGTSPHVEVFQGSNLTLLQSFFAFAAGSVNGVTVAVGDVNGDGKADIIVGAGSGAPVVHIFDGATNNLIDSFTVSGKSTGSGGVRVAVADIDDSGTDQLIAALNGTSVVDRYRISPNLAPESSFQAFPSLLTSVYVGAA